MQRIYKTLLRRYHLRMGHFRTSYPPWALSLVLVLALALAYSNTLEAPFILDDIHAIVQNSSLWGEKAPWSAFSPPRGSSLSGRPITSFSLSLNFLFWGSPPWSFHLVNLAIHMGSALLLMAILRQTLALKSLQRSFGDNGLFLSFFIALFWALSPLQTGAVTYVSQRSECLMGFFFFLVLYFAVRGWGSSRSSTWHGLALAAFFLGAGSKQVMVSAPLCVFFYDWLFVSKGAKLALKRSPVLYMGLAAGFFLAMAWGLNSGQAALDAENKAAPLDYLVTQAGILVHYLKLSIFPYPLCLDYAWQVRPLSQVWPQALLILALLGATVWGLANKRAWSYPWLWFFLILGPTSSFFPLMNLAFENRMYLPLAGVLAFFVLGGFFLLKQTAKNLAPQKTRALGLAMTAILLAIGLALGAGTFVRNRDYESRISIWKDTVEKAPHNFRARLHLGQALAGLGHHEEALEQYTQAVRLYPDNAILRFNLANALMRNKKPDEAINQYRLALEQDPDFFQAHYNLGRLLHKQGKRDEALRHLEKARQMASRARANGNGPPPAVIPSSP